MPERRSGPGGRAARSGGGALSPVEHGRGARAAAVCHRAALGLVLPVLLSLVAYYGFVSGYTRDVFDREGFVEQYESSVYRYRALGPELVLAVDQWLREHPQAVARIPRGLRRVPAALADDPSRPAEPTLYLSYFAVNTLFLTLALFLLLGQLAAVDPARPGADGGGRATLLYLFAATLVALTQYVVVPYDALSYLLLVVGMALARRTEDGRSSFALAALAAVVVVATLVRESSLVLVAFWATLRLPALRRRERRALAELAVLAAAFAVTYLVPRGATLARDQTRLVENLTGLLPLAGLALLVVVSGALVSVALDRRRSLRFLGLALPYLLAVLLVGEAWEVRLWVPVWLGLVLLAAPSQTPCSDRSAGLSPS